MLLLRLAMAHAEAAAEVVLVFVRVVDDGAPLVVEALLLVDELDVVFNDVPEFLEHRYGHGTNRLEDFSDWRVEHVQELADVALA